MDPFNTGIPHSIHPPSCHVPGPGPCSALDHRLCWRYVGRVKTSFLNAPSYLLVHGFNRKITSSPLAGFLNSVLLSFTHQMLLLHGTGSLGKALQVGLHTPNLSFSLSSQCHVVISTQKASLLTTSPKHLGAKGVNTESAQQ